MVPKGVLNVMIDTLSVPPSAGGVGTYLRELVREAALNRNVSLTLICSTFNYGPFTALDLGRIRLARIPWSTRSRIVRVLTQQLVIPFIALRYRPDVLFAPLDIAPLAAPVPVVTCIHSSHLNRLYGYGDGFLQELYNRIFMWGTLKRSTRVIVISDYVRRKTAQMFDCDVASMQVVYHGGGLVERARMAGWSPPLDDERDGGILFVGSLYRHKRADALIRAYARLKQRWPGEEAPKLYLVGKDMIGMRVELEKIAEQEGVADAVCFLGRVTDESLLRLYGTSRLLVLPSEVEGFGLPIVEAMQAGLPVVTSIHGSLPEIAGSAAICIDPNDLEEFAEAMRRALLNRDLRARMIEEGFLRGALFDWQGTASETLTVLKAGSVGTAR